MATEIKGIPILYGKDAENFINRMIKAENTKVSKEEIKRINERADKLKRILNKAKI